LHELESKLRMLESTLKMVGRAARRIETSNGGQEHQSDALSSIRESVERSRQALSRLATCRGRLKPPDNLSKLRLAVRYWCYEGDDKSVIEGALREIDEEVRAMQFALTCVHT
jgi:hypothetical protein